VPRALLVRRGIAFVGAAAIPTWLAFHGGGFDLVDRQETAVVVWWAIAAGFAIGVLPRGRLDRSLIMPGAALAGLVCWTFLSLSWTESDERTWEELSRLLGYAGFAVLAWATLNRYTFRAAAAGLSAAAFGVSLVAVASRLAPADFPVDEVAIAFDTDRLNYPFDYWNAVAAWGSISIAIGLCWSAHARHAAVRALCLAAVPVAGLAVYLTYSRGGVLSAALAVIAALALSRNRWTAAIHAAVAGAGTGVAILVVRANPAIADATGGAGGEAVAAALLLAALGCGGLAALTAATGIDRVRVEPRVARIGVPAAVASLLLVVGIAGHGLVSDAWDEFTEDEVSRGTGTTRLTTAGGDRNEVWSSALDAFGSDSFKGIGPGTFEYWWSRDGRIDSPVVDAHSLYLETMAELGAVGLLLLLAVAGGLILVALRGRARARRTTDLGASAAMTAGFVVFLFHAGLDWLWEFPALVALGVGGAAIAAAATSSRRASETRLAPALRVAAVAAAFAFGFAQVPGLTATERVRDSERELADGRARQALASADEAVSAEPWAATPRSQRALAEESLGDLEAARDDLLEAREREPTNWRWAAQLARVEGALGDPAAAAAANRDARTLNRVAPR
jgi:O-Antigen ligase